MPKMNFHPDSLFDTNQGENAVWSQLQAALAERDGDTFYRLPIIDGEGRFVFEPDIVVALRGAMPLVIECKGCRLGDIKSIQGAVWLMAETWYRAQENPFNQARSQAIALGRMLAGAGASAPMVHSLVALPFIARADWEARFGALGVTPGILFADDILSLERLAARILETATRSRLDPDQWNRFAQVMGAHDRWTCDAAAAQPAWVPRVPAAAVVAAVPEGQAELPITILRYAGRPPTAAEIAATVGIDLDPDPSGPQRPYTYLVATAALERQRSRDGLGGQHQLKKQLRSEVTPSEEMQLLFHKALRHFIAREVLSRAEERVLIQRAIHELAQGDRAVSDQLRRDVFAWRDVLAEIEEEGIDLAAAGAGGAQWAHPDLERIAGQLQSTYRKMRRSSARARQTFEESARQYLATQYVPTPIVVMEGFTRLTPLQQEFIERCAGVPGLRLWIVLPDNADQQAGFAALDCTYRPFLARARLAELPTPVLGEQQSLAYLQHGLFSPSAAPRSHADEGVALRAFPHRNDEVAYCVGEVIRLVHDERVLAARDIAIVCSDAQAMAPLLREEAELRGHADLFSVPPRQLLLTPVGRFILVLYEVWKDDALEIDAGQLAALCASGWLGAHVQKRAEFFAAVSHEHFTFCRSKADWQAALDRIRQQMGERDAVLGQLASRLPSSLVTSEDLVHWGEALDVVERLCQRVFVAGERTIGDHIALLLDQMQQLVPHQMLRTERKVLEDIRDALKDIVDSRSVAIDANEFGEVLGSLIHEREGEEDGDLPGSDPGPRPQQVWVVGPEGIDNIERHTVFFLGLDESRMPAPGSPPWPRIDWSARDHTERQRYRFLAVIRAARQRLLLSYARQDWERRYQPSPYFDEVLYLLNRAIDADAPRSSAPAANTASAVSLIEMKRERYTVSELATYRLCPYRFKMEALTDSAGVYTSAWQLEWLARGIWLAEALYLIASKAPGRHSAAKVGRLMERAIIATRANAMARLPGLRPLAWTGIERHVRDTAEYMLKPAGRHALPLLGIELPRSREKTKQLVIGGRRHVEVVGGNRLHRGPRPLPERRQGDQPVGLVADRRQGRPADQRRRGGRRGRVQDARRGGGLVAQHAFLGDQEFALAARGHDHGVVRLYPETRKGQVPQEPRRSLQILPGRGHLYGTQTLNSPAMSSTLHQPIDTNDEQKVIVAHVRDHRLTVVSAGAGAGKTYTTVAGIIELLGRKEASADQFILITFTNKAADHLRHALHKALSQQIRHARAEPARRMYWLEQRERLSCAYIGTIHGFCRQILSLHGYGAGVSREASISFAGYVRNQVIEQAVEDWLAQSASTLAERVRSGTYPEYKMRKLLGRMLEGVRNQGMDAQQLLEKTLQQASGWGQDGRIELARLLAEVERHYRETCQEAQQLDSAGLLEKTLELLRSSAGGRVAQSLAARFRFLFIDEFQDTTDTQAAIVDVLARDMTVLVVGDRKQSIYAFAGAEVSLLEQFAARHKTSCLPLKRSGRPTLPLLQAQNALFKKMREHFPELDDPLEASGRNHSPADGLAPIEVILAPDHAPTAVAEATRRVGNLLGMTMDRPASEGGPRPVRPADIAVLVRTNTEVGQWVKHLEEAGIPARSDTGISYLSQPEIVGMYRFLQLLARYPDDVALVEALSTPHFAGIDLRLEEKRLLAYGFQRGRPLTEEYERIHGPHAATVRDLLHKSRTATVPQLFGLVEQAFELKDRYREQGLDSAAVNLDRLRDYARNRFNSDQALTLRTFLDMLHRDIMNDTETRDAAEQETEGEGQVTVMTVHRSKGLEFPIVIVPGIAEERLKSAIPEFVPHKKYGLELNVRDLGVFPSAALKNEWRAMQQHLLAEEMRLFYVAVTRAKHMVCLFGVQLQPGDERAGARSWQAEVLAARVEMEQCGAAFRLGEEGGGPNPGTTDQAHASAGIAAMSDATIGPEPVARVS